MNSEIQLQMIVDHLGSTGISICPNFLRPSDLSQTCADLAFSRTNGQFRDAQVGSGTQRRLEPQVRSDQICWLDRLTQNQAQTLLWEKLDSLKAAFNKNLFLGLSDFEGHYAVYPVGGIYQRHLDHSPAGQSRVVSLILYLNLAWTSADGGELRVYREDGSYTGVLPIGGTLVCFMSQESEHEVMPSHSERSSFAGWYKRNN